MNHEKHQRLIIQGSARSQGDTFQACQLLQSLIAADHLDLLPKNIGPFDYDFKNRDDDFLPVMREIVAQYDTLIFATPVYWYSMSGLMKDFFDRISDLLKIEKETGRLLRGKNMAMLSVSGANDRPEGFSMPFAESANYLGMNYLGDVHVWMEGDQLAPEAKKVLREFAQKLNMK